MAGVDLTTLSDAQLQQMLATAQAQQQPQAAPQRPGVTLTPVSGDPFAGFADAPPTGADPYAGLGRPAPLPARADPYAGLGTPVHPGADPFAGFADAPPTAATSSGGPDLSGYSDAQLDAMLRSAQAGQGQGATRSGQPAPLTIRGTPQSAGDALDVVEGTGTAAYDTGAPEGGATYGDRARNLGGAVAAGLGGIATAVPFTDRMAAAAAAATGLGGRFGDYSGNLAQLHREEAAAAAAHPAAALAGGLVGGAALPFGALGDVAAAGSLGGKVLAGARAGGVIGGLQGASSSQDLGNVGQTAWDTGFGGLIGAGVGGLAPALGAGAGAAYRGLLAPAVREAPGVPAAAREMVAQAIRNDGPDAVMARLRQLGPDATLSDLGPSLQGIAMGQAVKDGPGAAIVLNNLAGRQRGASDRMLSDLEQAIGPAQNADAVGRQIADVGQAATQPYFARAYAAGVPQGADLDALMQRPAVVSGVRDAATLAANRGAPFPTVTLDAAGNQVGPQAAVDAANAATRPAVDAAVGALLGDQGGTIGTAAQMMQQRARAASPLYRQAYAARMSPDQIPVGLMPRLELAGAVQSATRDMRLDGVPVDLSGVQGWDYMKRALDQQIGVARRGGQNNDARILTGLKNELTGALDDAVPSYAQARQAFAGPSAMLEALQQGQEAAGNGVMREQVAGDFGQLGTEGERQMYRLGLGNAFRERLAQAGDGSNFADRVSGNQQIRDKLASVAPSPQALDAFNAHMDRARQTFGQAQVPTAQGFHSTLDALDARAAQTGDAGVTAARDALAARLGRNQDFARGRALQADYGNPAVAGSGALPQALDAGRTALRGGPNAIHPDDYAAAFAGLTPAGQAAQRAGLGDAIYRKLGDTRNDLTAINDVVKGPNDRSRAIIGTTFGQGAADQLAASADREGAFAKTYNDVLQGSMTARRLAMQKAQADAEYRPYQLHERHDITAEGLAYTAAVKPVNALLRLFQQPVDNGARDAALSTLTTTRGEANRQALVRLLRAQNAADAGAELGAPIARAGTALTAASPAALAAALRGRQQPGR